MGITTELPEVNITTNDLAMETDFVSMLESIVVVQRQSQPSYCELIFLFSEREPTNIDIGTELKVTVGPELDSLFVGDVTACRFHYGLNGQKKMVVRCYDSLHKLRKSQHLQQFEDIDISTLASNVVSGLGLSVEYHGDDITMAQVLQWRQSDLALLTQVTQKYGKYFSLWDTGLQVFSTEGVDTNIELKYGENLFSLDVELNSEPACRSVEVLAWDPQRAEAITSEVNDKDLSETATHPVKIGVTGERYLTGQTVFSDEEASFLARATIQRRVSGEATMQGVAEGSIALKPGAQVSINEAESVVSGRYTLTEVTHRIDGSQGYTSELSSAPLPLLERELIFSSLGLVIDIDDPESIGRIKVRYPDLGMLESLWLEVVHPGAGLNKGVMALPDVDDKVLVLFINGDPGQGVVLGGLYGEQGPPDVGIEGGQVTRYTFVTPGGQKLTLDDDGEKIKLENSDGSYVYFSSSEMRLHSKQNMVIEAPGKSLVIGADTIDFKQR